MPKITRDEIVQNPLFQNSDDALRNSVASPTLKSLKTLSYRSVDDTRALIMHECLKAKQPLSRGEICKRLKRSKSPALVRLIEDLVAEGLLRRDHEVRPNGVVMYYYSIGFRIDAHGEKIPDWLDA